MKNRTQFEDGFPERHGVCHIDKGDEPDTSGMNQAAVDNAQTGRDSLAFWREIYEDSAPAREQAAETARQVSLSQVRGMDAATEMARQTYEQGAPFRDAERAMLSDALNFDTEGKREELAGLALGDVNEQFASAREQGTRAMTRMGMNPADGSFAAGNRQLALSQALAGAHAKNTARRTATDMGHARKMDALSLARGLPAQQATQQGIALSAGNSAVGNAQVPVTMATAGGQIMQQGFDAATRGNTSAGNLYGQIAQINNQSSGGGDWLGGIANLGMAGKYIFSDKRMKKDRKPVKPGLALSQARQMPVDTWKYKDDSPAADGGREHVGPVAQAVQKAMGDGAAPGGRMVDLGSLAGVTLAAVQDLDKNVQRLEKKVISLADAKHRQPAKKQRSA